MPAASATADWRDDFPLDPDLAYLNHAALGPWPRRTAERLSAFAAENAHTGAAGYLGWLEVESALRERLATLINAPDTRGIGLVKNTSEGLSLVAQGLPWEAGDNIVGIAHEFPSNRVVWEALAPRGVAFRPVDVLGATDPEGALLAATDRHTRLLAISSVHYARGLRLDLARLAEHCQRTGILLCIDAIQSLGALHFDLADCPADFVIADGHKWLLGPEGLGLFYCAPAAMERLSLQQFGWHMLDAAGDYDRDDWRPARTAQRFECGSPNLLGAHALEASLSLLLEIGTREVERQVLENAAALSERLQAVPGLTIRSPEAPARRSGIINFTVDGIDTQALYAALMQRRVICAARGGGVRFAPHFHTPAQTLDLAVTRLRDVIDTLA